MPTICKVLKLGIFPKIVIFDLGIANLILSPTLTFNEEASESPKITSFSLFLKYLNHLVQKF